ncbi:MAG: hypothetical protein HETSPECPRED_005946 [Heterodermia speciosa]|uniref:Exonuclease domain-containing protein n=1 Tax=Heterodermia speciosa TaxID=116794 RepID=A0A8H3J832_9LECA|nr:MAG: hypothetical protein HETSPECPRED_005946 [Heterodermia speciosa]
MAPSRSQEPLVWIDCEMTGLDVERDTIMSISCFLTSPHLELLDDQGWDAIIHHDKSTLDQMNEWCINTHGKSGLTAATIASSTTAEVAADGLLAYIKQNIHQPRKALLAGNSVHCDKEFLKKAPYNKIIDYLGHRILDVSSIKEAARRWAPTEILEQVPKKQGLHQAREDILESIEEARFYRHVFFQTGEAGKN